MDLGIRSLGSLQGDVRKMALKIHNQECKFLLEDDCGKVWRDTEGKHGGTLRSWCPRESQKAFRTNRLQKSTMKEAKEFCS